MNMFEFFNPISPALREKLEQPDVTLVDLLEDDGCAKAFSHGFDPLISFFLENSEELLTMALNLEDKLSSKAFKIISTQNENFHRAFFKSGILSQKVDTVLVNDVDPVVVNRFAMLTQVCCLTASEFVSENCDFLKKFIPFLKHRSVYEMFAGWILVKRDNEDQGTTNAKAAVQEFIKADGFVDALLETIAQLPDSGFEAHYVSTLFKTITLFKESATLLPAISTNDAVKILVRNFENADLVVLNAQWAAVAAALNGSNISVIVDQIPRFVAMLERPEEETFFSAYQLSAIQILTKIITEDMTQAGAFVEAKVPQMLAAILRRYRRHTLAAYNVTEFTLGVLSKVKEMDALAELIMDTIVPVAVEFANEEASIEERAFGWNLLMKLEDLNETIQNKLQEIESYTPAVKDLVMRMKSCSEARYGGEKPVDPVDDGGQLGNLSQEQLLALLRFITGARR